MKTDDNSTTTDVVDDYVREAADQVAMDLTENPGAVIELDPDVAEYMGAFEDNAVSFEEAMDARFDLVAPPEDEQLP